MRLPTCLCGTCKKCKQRETARRWRERNPGKAEAISKAWAQEHPEAIKQADEKRRPARREKEAVEQNQRYESFDWLSYTEYVAKQKSARWAVKSAIKRGLLLSQPCWCGSTPTHAHHENYDKPLDVVWLCPTHHVARHCEIRSEKGEAKVITPRKIKNKGG